jgi:hypothetical protein
VIVSVKRDVKSGRARTRTTNTNSSEPIERNEAYESFSAATARGLPRSIPNLYLIGKCVLHALEEEDPAKQQGEHHDYADHNRYDVGGFSS